MPSSLGTEKMHIPRNDYTKAPGVVKCLSSRVASEGDCGGYNPCPFQQESDFSRFYKGRQSNC